MIRRVGDPPHRDRSYILRPGVYAILPLKDRFLLTMQTDPIPDIQLPGGGIDPGESPLQALYREVREETGWTIASPRRLGAFRRFVFMPEYELWAEKLCHVYVARPVRQAFEITEPSHQVVVLDSAAAIEALGNDGDRQFLAQFLR